MEPKRTLSQKNTFMLIEKQKPLSSRNVYISERRGGQPNIFWYISILSFEKNLSCFQFLDFTLKLGE